MRSIIILFTLKDKNKNLSIQQILNNTIWIVLILILPNSETKGWWQFTICYKPVLSIKSKIISFNFINEYGSNL